MIEGKLTPINKLLSFLYTEIDKTYNMYQLYRSPINRIRFGDYHEYDTRLKTIIYTICSMVSLSHLPLYESVGNYIREKYRQELDPTNADPDEAYNLMEAELNEIVCYIEDQIAMELEIEKEKQK